MGWGPVLCSTVVSHHVVHRPGKVEELVLEVGRSGVQVDLHGHPEVWPVDGVTLDKVQDLLKDVGSLMGPRHQGVQLPVQPGNQAVGLSLVLPVRDKNVLTAKMFKVPGNIFKIYLYHSGDDSL